jgi:hydroxypyruvate reductase
MRSSRDAARLDVGLALALARALESAGAIAALAADTDGPDGAAGDPASALIHESTLPRARNQGLNAAHLADNDSTGFFERLDDLVTPGPTHTNLNDCRIILIG